MDKLSGEIEAFRREWRSDCPYIVAHTSGSTGKPKEIHLPKSLMKRSAERSIRHFGITASSRLHLALSPQYIAGKMLLLRAMIAGCTLTYEQASSYPLGDSKEMSEITLLSLVGTQLQGLKNNLEKGTLPPIRNLLLGGAPLNATMRRIALSGPWQTWESYGMTETASHVALRRISAKPGPFEALPGISFRLNADGCLVIDLGEDGVIETNDIAELIDTRRFHLKGRKDNVIITGGLKVFPEEIEAVLAPHMADRRFLITSRESEKWGRELILVVEGTPMELPDFHTMPLLPQQRPKAVIFRESIPLTSSGKIMRNASF